MKVCSACERELSRECFSKKQWQMKRFRRCKECIDGHCEIENPTEERDERSEIMKACSACRRELSGESFSKKQWQMKRFRRCKECIDEHREIENSDEERDEQPETTSLLELIREEQRDYAIGMESTFEFYRQIKQFQNLHVGASCWICLAEGPDDEGERLVRDCCCRGGSGYAHVRCLVDYAKSKSQNEDTTDRLNFNFLAPFTFCPNCNEQYEHELSICLAEEAVSFVKSTYPGCSWRLLEALYLKLETLQGMSDVIHPLTVKEFHRTAGEILVITGRWKAEYARWPMHRQIGGIFLNTRALEIEAGIYHGLGIVALYCQTEHIETALKNLEKSREINKVIGDAERLLVVESDIHMAKYLVSGGSMKGSTPTNEELKKWQKLYDQHAEALGEDKDATIRIGIRLVYCLDETGHTAEAVRLINRMIAMSERVYGRDHETTLLIKTMRR